MADEILGTVSVRYKDAQNRQDFLSQVDFTFSLTTARYTKYSKTVGIVEEALNLGEVTSPGFCAIRNYDATNFVEVLTGTGGTRIGRVPPLTTVLFHFPTAVTAPYIIADTATCECDVLLANR